MIKLQQILESINVIAFVGNEQAQIANVVPLNEVAKSENCLAWCSDKNYAQLQGLAKGTIIVSAQCKALLAEDNLNEGTLNLVVVDNARKAFKDVLIKFFAPEIETPKVESSASVAENVEISKTNYIGKNVVIEQHVSLGENVRIGHNSVIHANTIIESNVSIGCNCTIGGAGFGYEKNESGENEFIPHIGKVTIKSGVEIGNNVCIDRAVLGSTTIGNNVKIDNLVHIAHGVNIGKNSLVIAHAMIAGSVKIGENVWVAPSSAIIQKVKIANNATIGLGSVVLNDVKENTTVAGVPAKQLKDGNKK